MNIFLLNGPNLNLLGEREVDIYGKLTLPQLVKKVAAHAKKRGAALKARQANGEGELIDLLHAQRKWADGVIFNPGAYTHYSYALRDAIAAIAIPTVEVHLSDVMNREEFRRVSVIEPVCAGRRFGKGLDSYLGAVDDVISLAQEKSR